MFYSHFSLFLFILKPVLCDISVGPSFLSLYPSVKFVSLSIDESTHGLRKVKCACICFRLLTSKNQRGKLMQ